jgi:GT2 family glycosyltransferase
VRGFRRRPDVACVTGLVCTASLSTAAELYFDARVSWADSCSPRIFDLSPAYADGLYPYSPGRFGTGANFAFRTETLRALGGFDEALGAGSRTRGGEDLDVFVRVLLAGYALAYEPAAVVWHHHRSDLPELQRQMFAYGTGLTAFLAKHLLDRATRRELLRRVPQGVRRMLAIPGATERALEGTAVGSRSLLVRELAGCVAGPAYYIAARRALPRAEASEHLEAAA